MWTEKINANSYTNLTFLLLLQLSSVSYWIWDLVGNIRKID
jgi:hypothetical protein